MEILRGLLMSDGWIQRDGSAPNFRLEMTNRVFLEWLDDKLEWLSNGITLKRTADEAAESLGRENNGTYSDCYFLSTPRHPSFQCLAEWYNSGKKVWPNSVTPMELKMLYVGDGSIRHGKHLRRDTVQISAENEMGRVENIRKIFEPYDIDPTLHEHVITLTPDDTEKFFNVVGDPVPGFEYKWPNR